MYTLIGDPFFFRINKLNNAMWNSGGCDKDNLEDYIGKQYDVEVDAKRIEDNFRIYFEDKHGKFTNRDLINLIFKSFKGSYIVLLLLKLSLIITMCFLAFSLKRFHDSFGKGSEYVKGVTLIVNQIIEVLFNIYVDYYTELLHIRVRGSLTLFITTLLLNGKILVKNNNSFHDTKKFAKIQNVIAVDGEFSEYMISYGIELILFPLNLLLLFGISNIFIANRSIWLCIIILILLGIISITSQWISSCYKKQFMESREERIACMTKSLSENDDFVLTHLYDIFYLNIVDRFRRIEMKFNKYRKYWFCLGEVMSYWMEIFCTIVICIYCYFHNYSNSQVSSILANCSFIVPILTRPISSIAYFTYYLVEALNALNRINSIINDFQYNEDLQYSKFGRFTSLRNVEYIKIKDVSSHDSNIVLNKGILNVVMDSNDKEHDYVDFFKQLLISANYNLKSFYIYVKLRNEDHNDLLCIPNLQLITKSVCHVNQKCWIFENSTIKEAIICDRPFDESLWNLVIQTCQLNVDIANGSIQLDENINIRQISTGQRVRISLARSLYNAFYNNKDENCCIYLIENIFDFLDKVTGCKLIYSLFSKNQPYYGLLSSSFGMVSVKKELYDFFVYTVYLQSCKNESLIECNENEHIQLIQLKDQIRVNKIQVKSLSFDNDSFLTIIQDCFRDKSKPESKNNEWISDNLNDVTTQSHHIDIGKDFGAFLIKQQRKFVSNSLYYYLFHTSDQIKYKYNTEANKLTGIKRSKTLVFVYLLLSIVPVLIFKITEYRILNYLTHSATLFKDLLKYIYLCFIILVNYFVTIFLEIYIGLKSANYIHNTVLYGYLSTYSILKVVPVSSIIGHLTNDQIVVDYCITKRIGQILNYLNKIFAFMIISVVINSRDPVSFLPFALLYVFFIYWNFLSYFINTCRVLRLKFLSNLTSLTNVVHSINSGIEDIQNSNFREYFEKECLNRTKSFLAPLYSQNVLFTWLRLRIDFLLPISLNSMNVILPIIFSRMGGKEAIIPNIFIYVIGVGLTIPKVTSSAAKYWVKLENELLAVTRIKLLVDALMDDKPNNNLKITDENDSLLMSLNNVEARYYRLKNDPFSTILNEYHRLTYDVCLKKINLEIRKNDVIGIIGKTGSGKTSFLKLLGGIIETSSGSKIIYIKEDNKSYQLKDEEYKMNESSLKKVEKISNLSDIDPLILINSINILELSSCTAYLPIKVEFPGNLTLMELLNTNERYSVSDILDLLCLFNLIRRKYNPGKEVHLDESSSLLNKDKLEILHSPISCFKFNRNQHRLLLLLRLIINNHKYKLILIDEPPSQFILKNNQKIALIDYVIKRYFLHCSVIIASHKIENITSINRLIVINDNHSISEISRSDLKC